jgi:hypothetical protein
MLSTVQTGAFLTLQEDLDCQKEEDKVEGEKRKKVGTAANDALVLRVIFGKYQLSELARRLATTCSVPAQHQLGAADRSIPLAVHG